MANTTTGIPVFYFRPDPSPGTEARESDPAYELGNIQNISTTLNPEAVEIIRSHGDAPRAAGMPQVSQSVNYEITISELGILPMLIITGAGGHNIREDAGIVSTNRRSADSSLQELIEFDFRAGEGRYDRQRWYRIGSEFMLPTASLASNLVESINPIVYDDTSSDNILISRGTQNAPTGGSSTVHLWSTGTDNVLSPVTTTGGSPHVTYSATNATVTFNSAFTVRNTRVVGYLLSGNLRTPIVPIEIGSDLPTGAQRLQIGNPVDPVLHLELSRVTRITGDDGTGSVNVPMTSGSSGDYTFGTGADNSDTRPNSIAFTTTFDANAANANVLIEGNVLNGGTTSEPTPFVVTDGKGSSRTQAIEGVDFVVNRSLGLIRFTFQDDNRNYEDPNSRVTVYARRQAIPNSDQELEMAQWMVSRYRTTYGRGDLYVYDDEGVVVWGHTQFRCTVWCSGDITFNPTEIATATITVAVETDSQGRTGYQFGDTSRLPF